MLKNAELYDFTQNLQGNLFFAAQKSYTGEVYERPALLNLRRGYAESPSWMMVQMLEFAPEGMTVEKFRRRAIYSAPKLSLALLELLASEGWLDRSGEEYHLTEVGQIEAEKIKRNRIRIFADFEPIPQAEMTRLVALMAFIIEASIASNALDNWSLLHSRNRAPAENESHGAKLMQFGSDFNAYRDDAHMAAYRAYGIDGYVWEAFSTIATGQAQNASDLYKILAYRGFYTEDWQAALEDLAKRGYLAAGQITTAGQAVRETVEAQTDAYFFAPWASLNETEFAEMLALMQKLDSACQALTQ